MNFFTPISFTGIFTGNQDAGCHGNTAPFTHCCVIAKYLILHNRTIQTFPTGLPSRPIISLLVRSHVTLISLLIGYLLVTWLEYWFLIGWFVGAFTEMSEKKDPAILCGLCYHAVQHIALLHSPHALCSWICQCPCHFTGIALSFYRSCSYRVELWLSARFVSCLF